PSVARGRGRRRDPSRRALDRVTGAEVAKVLPAQAEILEIPVARLEKRLERTLESIPGKACGDQVAKAGFHEASDASRAMPDAGRSAVTLQANAVRRAMSRKRRSLLRRSRPAAAGSTFPALQDRL